jgi:hypothetical protein
MKKFCIATAIAAILTLGATASFADTTYTYTGNPFTTAAPGFTEVSGSFTLPNPLGDNLNKVSLLLPVNFNFSDGVNVYTPASTSKAGGLDLIFSTDATGKIIGWAIMLANGGSLDPTLDSFNQPGQVGDQEVNSGTGNIIASNHNDPGTWTVSTGTTTQTPEPGSLVLVAPALLALAGIACRKVRG